MNHLAHLTALRNRYFVLRHGESLANVAGMIVSDPHHGVGQYGLTTHGQQQVRHTLAQHHTLDPHTRIYSSDFLRAQETARLAQAQLGVTADICLCLPLRERYFGHFEGTSTDNYQQVWSADSVDPWHTHHGVESVMAVLDRVTRFVRVLEQRWHGHTIVLVSHGDPLQILQTGFSKQSPATHRQLPPLQPAELRELQLATGSD
jgi:probable phosphoglycerate mutase